MVVRETKARDKVVPKAPRAHAPVPTAGGRELIRTRVLVAFGEEHRAYRGVIAAGIRLLHPHTEVSTAGPAELGVELERFGPHVVVCGVPGRPDQGHTPAWVELPPEVGRPARVRVGDRRREALGLTTLEGLLGVVDEAEALVRTQVSRAGGQGPPGVIHPTA
jgi:hypothetical protein